MSQQSEPVPYYVANQKAIEVVQAILFQMKQPMNSAAPTQTKLHNDLRSVLKEILETTQRLLMLNRAGKANGVKADGVGWTTATTDYDNETVLAEFPHGRVVNNILRELIKEQEQNAIDQGVAISQTQIINAQNDAVDPTKDHINLDGLKDPETGITSRIEINKETGDTQLHRLDEKTGLWVKVGSKLKGFWINTKDFCKNIWGWITRMFNKAKNWIKNLFSAPEDSQVILSNT